MKLKQLNNKKSPFTLYTNSFSSIGEHMSSSHIPSSLDDIKDNNILEQNKLNTVLKLLNYDNDQLVNPKQWDRSYAVILIFGTEAMSEFETVVL